MELNFARSNPNVRLSAPAGRLGPTYAEYMASHGGGGSQSWLDADTERRARVRAEEDKPSEVTNILFRRREYIRGLYADYGKDALAENERQTGRAQASSDQSIAQRGLYSTTVRDALRNRINEAGARSRGSIQSQIVKDKADAEFDLTGDIAKNISHERDVKANYLGAIAQGDAQRRAQQQSQLVQGVASVASIGILAAMMS